MNGVVACRVCKRLEVPLRSIISDRHRRSVSTNRHSERERTRASWFRDRFQLRHSGRVHTRRVQFDRSNGECAIVLDSAVFEFGLLDGLSNDLFRLAIRRDLDSRRQAVKPESTLGIELLHKLINRVIRGAICGVNDFFPFFFDSTRISISRERNPLPFHITT